MVREVITDYRKDRKEFDTFVMLQPTSPLRTAEDIINACEEYNLKCAWAVVSVCEAEHQPALCNTLPEDGSMDCFIDKKIE